MLIHFVNYEHGSLYLNSCIVVSSSEFVVSLIHESIFASFRTDSQSASGVVAGARPAVAWSD